MNHRQGQVLIVFAALILAELIGITADLRQMSPAHAGSTTSGLHHFLSSALSLVIGIGAAILFYSGINEEL